MKKHSFTLIELIVVIAIIAVLATSGVLLMSKRFSSARDSSRMQDIQVMKTALNLTQVENTSYPMPQDNFTVYDTGGAIAWYQGDFGDLLLQTVKSINNIPIDPSTKSPYGYSITWDKKKFQVRAFLESGKEYTAISKVYAQNVTEKDLEKYAKMEGNYNGYLITQTGGNYFLWNVPSLFVRDAENMTGFKLGAGKQNVLVSGQKPTYQPEVKTVDMTDMVEGVNQDSTKEKISQEFGVQESDVDEIIKKAGGGGEIKSSTIVNGKCGTNSGANLLTAPVDGLCDRGTPTSVIDNGEGSTFDWSCEGIDGGSDVSCSANHVTLQDGICGSDDGQDLLASPSNLCDQGNPVNLTDNGLRDTYTWTCQGYFGGTDDVCSANHVKELQGICGTSNGVSTYTQPSTNICVSTGGVSWTDSSAADNEFNRDCLGQYGGADKSCIAPKSVDATCGSANGSYFAAQPTSNLCSIYSSITWTDTSASDGTWNRTCVGINNGNNVNCSSNDLETIVTYGSGRRWSDGTYATSCDQYKNNPPSGYSYAGSTGNGNYRVDVNGGSSSDAILAYCDMTNYGGGWTVISYARDTKWASYFNGWTNYGSFAGRGINSRSWKTWFKLDDASTEFRRSSSCTTVSSEGVYRMTGNYFGCTWHSDGNAEYPGKPVSPYYEYSAGFSYPYICNFDRRNTAPSIGISGSYCVAYR